MLYINGNILNIYIYVNVAHHFHIILDILVALACFW